MIRARSTHVPCGARLSIDRILPPQPVIVYTLNLGGWILRQGAGAFPHAETGTHRSVRQNRFSNEGHGPPRVEIGISLPNSQRQHRASHAPEDVLQNKHTHRP